VDAPVFIGSNFVKQFKKSFPKTKILGIDDFSTGRKEALERSIIFYHDSILNEKLLGKFFLNINQSMFFISQHYPPPITQLNIHDTRVKSI